VAGEGEVLGGRTVYGFGLDGHAANILHVATRFEGMEARTRREPGDVTKHEGEGWRACIGSKKSRMLGVIERADYENRRARDKLEGTQGSLQWESTNSATPNVTVTFRQSSPIITESRALRT
jgi:hypothetical protein